jgi:hypothetical protein
LRSTPLSFGPRGPGKYVPGFRGPARFSQIEPNKNYGKNGPGVMGTWSRASSYFESYAEGESEQSGGGMEVEGGNEEQDVWTESGGAR